ncbi:biotin/lipoyl-containing protein [Mycolicibacterium fallax]|uniref:biotin/lipoyl-containing protein n=1 Tax=Mycolicibacterium fallax TaxID=1793 RepID=UPI00138CC74D|nr:biotin/lipoyl-containing protein [Mycolicibacterium fallax]BBY96770.1 hypothetical protein MFAL_02370 [Mycolicibacterium fallax]HSA41002.1 hypothetical protein [Mycobacterium sp.]
MTVEVSASGGTRVAAPFAGALTFLVPDGAAVCTGQTIAIVEAMKMEAGITAPRPGVLALAGADGPVEGGELLAVIR